MKSRIKILRKSKGFTLADMANELGYKAPSGFHSLEKNINRVTLIQALKIANKLECKVEDLVEEEGKIIRKNSPKRVIYVRKVV